jgi:multisubunit Na+/H+ antiporter MnhC subunit
MYTLTISVMTIIVGYFLSKIAAALVSMPFSSEPTDTVDGVDMRFGMRLSRVVFWCGWSAASIYTLWRFAHVRNALQLFMPNRENLVELIMIIAFSLFAIMFLMLTGHLARWITGKLPQANNGAEGEAGLWQTLTGFGVVGLILLFIIWSMPSIGMERTMPSALTLLAGLWIGKLLGETVNAVIVLAGLPQEKLKMPIDVSAPFFHRRVHADPGLIVQALVLTAFVAALVRQLSAGG